MIARSFKVKVGVLAEKPCNFIDFKLINFYNKIYTYKLTTKSLTTSTNTKEKLT